MPVRSQDSFGLSDVCKGTWQSDEEKKIDANCFWKPTARPSTYELQQPPSESAEWLPGRVRHHWRYFVSRPGPNLRLLRFLVARIWLTAVSVTLLTRERCS